MSEALMQFLAYLVVCLSVVCYCILDGFDLGVGALHLFARNDHERRTFLNAIGPLWDGNAVWIIIVGGGLFVAFPPVFATLFSSFYTPTMILLAGLIFRAVAIEFRSKHESKRWRNTWDALFSLASMLIIFCVGVVIGNLIYGIPLNENQEFTGTFWSFFHFYPVMVGVMSIGLFMIHGLTFLLMKTEGDLHERMRKWTMPIMAFFVASFVVVSLMMMVHSRYMVARITNYPILYFVPFVTLGSIAFVPFFISRKKDFIAFACSSLSIIGLFSLFGIGTFPTMIRSLVKPELYSMNYTQNSAGPVTLQVFLTIVAIGVPLVLAYMFWIYKVFHGKVKMDHSSY